MDFPVAEIALPKRGPHYPGERGGSAEPSGCHEGPRGPAPRAQSGGEEGLRQGARSQKPLLSTREA